MLINLQKPSAFQLFQQCELSTDESAYALVKLSVNSFTKASQFVASHNAPFSAVILDKHEVSLLLPETIWKQMQSEFPEAEVSGTFSLITFECVLTLDVVGFMAVVSEILAQAEIPILALSAYSRDHIFVATEHFQKAWDGLKMAQASNH